MSDDLYAEGYTKWEGRYQAAAAGGWLLRPEPDFEVKLAVRAYQEQYDTRQAWALDLGAGDGRHTLYLAQQGFAVQAVDAAPSGVARIAAHLEEYGLGAQLDVADLRTYALPQEVDFLLASYVIHLLPAPTRPWNAGRPQSGPVGCVWSRRAGACPPTPATIGSRRTSNSSASFKWQAGMCCTPARKTTGAPRWGCIFGSGRWWRSSPAQPSGKTSGAA
ncbi:MAG: methyltransferase domain-containing protein [Anaerolineae bacterium]|nr:methyltransferase domain-containing protein [Anaerolineae bacterium]